MGWPASRASGRTGENLPRLVRAEPVHGRRASENQSVEHTRRGLERGLSGTRVRLPPPPPTHLIAPQYLGLAYVSSEVLLAVRKRARHRAARSEDRGTLPLVWIVITASVIASIYIAKELEFGRIVVGPVIEALVCALFLVGIALRWWAILVLGRFFTVDVAIHQDHQLITRGPYAFLRHPSYTGALLAIAGLGLSFENWVSVLVILVPSTAVMLVRIAVEERALALNFGQAWQAYSAHTKRLLPGVY